MSYIKPAEVINTMIDTGTAKANASTLQMVIRGFLGGAILAFATTLAFTAASQTSLGLAGALVFPAGFVIIVLLGLELVTGSFALSPLSVVARKTTAARMLSNYFWVIVGHLIGCAAYALLYGLVITKMFTDMSNPLIQMIIQLSETKTLGYKHMGSEGMMLVVIKAILCNWMVTLGVVMAMTSKSTGGKIIAMWLPIVIFFAQGFEHAVVNMFVIPAGMLLGADVSFADWWVWNQIPVLIGNFIGGAVFTGMLLYLSHHSPTSQALNVKATIKSEPAAAGAVTSKGGGL
ncbi:formate/nitrite transporter family protein [Paenibacillus sp. Leaf72]|uniref:formate/nitrite transporter family protein n=1 Tax=Paenibacillus sp. Leaf72 TaxID=1736234 RepID=UPI0006FD2274|nr:formate/nitrite transporter family protein [Paenibacillus sp. Leaf72]KQO01030.1 formate transporter [Paenibacillus sp. Leaf72]